MGASDQIIGVGPLGDLSWGAHVCHLYETKDDLTEILLSYLSAGLRGREMCIWVTSDPLGVDAAKAISDNLPTDFKDSAARGQIEILDWSEWYTRGEKFTSQEWLRLWLAKQKLAIAEGFRGLRIAANMSWLGREMWPCFMDYEALFDRLVRRSPTIALCSYPLENCGAPEFVDVVTSHRLVLVRRVGKWELLGNPPQKALPFPKGSTLSYAEIGRVLGLSRERVRQMVMQGRHSTRAPSDLITVGEASSFLNVHANTIRRWSDRGILRVYYVGPRLDRRFRRQELERLLRERKSADS